ncbi:MAG: DUF1697 domain-containing protein [Dehalogenimonas sp.]
MKYIAFIRGINVGGKNIIKMADLRKTVAKNGFNNVSIYIQSGNVIFESATTEAGEIAKRLEAAILKDFSYDSKIVVKSQEELKHIIDKVPSDWQTRDDLRCYIAFLDRTITMEEVTKEIELREGIDSIKTGEGVVYMSTLLSGLTRSRFTKLVSKIIYKHITIRNYNTARKILELMG